MNKVLSVDEAQLMASKFLDNIKYSSNDYEFYVGKCEDWEAEWFFYIGIKIINENNPGPVDGAVGIKVSKSTGELKYVSRYEANYVDYIKKLRQDLIIVLREFIVGKKITLQLRKQFEFKPSEALNIINYLEQLDLNDELTFMETIQELESRILQNK